MMLRRKAVPRGERRAGMRGFTLVELMITLLILGLIMTVIYRVFSTQEKFFRTQEQVAAMQENLRATVEYINQEMSWLGYKVPGISVIKAAPGEVIFKAASEVGSAVFTAVATTVVSFLPVFTLEAAEGKLFKPLAYTKTFALVAAVIVALTLIPPLTHLLLTRGRRAARSKRWWPAGLLISAVPASSIVPPVPIVEPLKFHVLPSPMAMSPPVPVTSMSVT